MENKNSILKFQIISGIIVAILGTLLHFTFNWSNQNVFVGIFSAVNESVWEHLKLLFFPTLLTTIVGYFYIGRNVTNFLCAKTIGIVVSMIFTVIFFYTYSGIIGEIVDIVNIISFFVAVVLGEYVAYRIMLSDFKCNKKIAIIIWIIIFVLFIIFTFNTPQIGIFEDPVTGGYGITNKY